MNETAYSSVWPSRSGLCDQFEALWPPQFSSEESSTLWTLPLHNQNLSDLPEDRNNRLKSIWNENQGHRSGASPEQDCALTSLDSKQSNHTPTNSPSLSTVNIINCNERWGNVKINQVTPWNVAEIDESDKRPHDPMVWRAKIDGTEVWEDYYFKQHGRRRPPTENSFNGDNVWTPATEMSQSTSSSWSPKMNENSTTPNDLYATNIFTDINTRSSFGATNGVRPSMTRHQAQKYLIDMGYSLSDAIGALVNNQMDLPKAINELQSKYRMPTNGQSMPPNGLYSSTPPFNTRPGDNMSRLPPGTPINSLLSQTNPSATPMMGSNFNSTFDLFQSESSEQIMDSPYMGMDPIMSQFGRTQDTKRQNSLPMNRDNIFRNTFPNNNNNTMNHAISNNSGQFPEMSVLSQGMNRMSINFGSGHSGMMAQNNSFSNKWSNYSNGFNGMHNSNNNANINNNNNSNNNMMLNGNGNLDMRQNFMSAMSGGGYGRSISKQQMFSRNPSWLPDNSSSISPNGALNDINQVRLAKTFSYPGGQESGVGIIIKKVPLHHIENIKALCYESGAMTNFQLHPQMQAVVVHFNSAMDARRCISIIQSQINVRVEILSEEFMSGGSCQQ